jgi:hypothetical protein
LFVPFLGSRQAELESVNELLVFLEADLVLARSSIFLFLGSLKALGEFLVDSFHGLLGRLETLPGLVHQEFVCFFGNREAEFGYGSTVVTQKKHVDRGERTQCAKRIANTHMHATFNF